MSKKKKIVFILGGLVGGGAEKVATTLIRSWNKANYEITVITRLDSKHDVFSLPENVKRISIGDKGESTNKIKALLNNIPIVWKLRKMIKKSEADIVIAFLTKANIHTILASLGLKKKVIISERNDTTRESHPWPWPLLRKFSYKFADYVTANSEVSLNDMKKYVPISKLQLILNPVAIPFEKAKPQSSNVIINVARLEQQKKQHILLQAFAQIENQLSSKWTIDILGEGSERKNLEKLSRKLEITESVHFRGFIKNPENFYRSSAIFVLTSEYEGTPNALLEALAQGLPCIVSDSIPGAFKYVIDGKNGYYFRSGDAIDLKKKLEILLKDPDMRKKFGSNSVMLVKDLNIDKIGSHWLRLFN